MAYVISNTSGSRNFVIPDEEINNDTSISLIGRNYSNYGEPIAENFVHMLENFANPLPPAPGITGQLWYDTTNDQLRVYSNAGTWHTASGIRVTQSDIPAETFGQKHAGAMYYDQELRRLYVHGASEYEAIIPGEIVDPTVYGAGNVIATTVPAGVTDQYGTRLRNIFLQDDADVHRAVLALDYQSNTQNAIAVFNGAEEFLVNVSAQHYSDGALADSAYINQLTDSDNLGTTIYPGLNVHNAAISDLRLSNALVALSNSVVLGSVIEPFDQGYFGTVTANTVIADLTGNVTGQVSDISNHNTDDLAEGSNLYFTVERMRGNISGSGNIIFDSNTGVISESLTTTDVDEGDNLYWTTARGNAMVADYDSDIDTSGNISASEFRGVLVGNVTGQVSDISNHDTGDLAEGTNLYYTTARVRGNVSAVTVPNAIGEVGNLSYNASTGVFTFTAPSTQRVRDHISGSASIAFSNSTGIVSVIPGGVDHDQLGNFMADEHVDHSEVFIVAGAGLVDASTGNITSNVTLNVGQGFGILVNPNDIAVNPSQIRGLLSIASGSTGILSYNNTTGAIGFSGNQSTAASDPSRWVFSGNVDQSVAGEKTFTGTTTFSFSNGPNLILEDEPAIRYGGGANPGNLRFESASDPGNVDITFTLTGDIIATGDITAFSDSRLKTDLEQITGALDKVSRLTGYVYARTDLDGKRQTGLIAQDVQKVLPEAVDDSGEYLGVSYGNMMGLIVESIKELQQQVADIQRRLGD